LEESGRGLINALSWNLPGGTEGNHGKLRIAGVLAEIRTERKPKALPVHQPVRFEVPRYFLHNSIT
jgi:hypothetical protein